MEEVAKLLLMYGDTCNMEKVKVEMQPVVSPMRSMSAIESSEEIGWLGETAGCHDDSPMKQSGLITEGYSDAFQYLTIGARSLNKSQTSNDCKQANNKSNGSCKPKVKNKCKFCQYTTPKMKNMEAHLRTHTLQGRKVYSCEECHYRCEESERFQVHMRYHSGVKPYACDECSYRSVEPGSLRRHKSNHRGEKPYGCTICPFRTAQKYELQRHVGKLHPDSNPTFSCSRCSFNCTKLGNLNKHKKTHDRVTGPYKCDKCSFTVDLRWRLIRHQISHSSEKLFACGECLYKAKSSDSLKRHIKVVHTRSAFYHCDKCEFSTKASANFGTHQLLHAKMQDV